MTRQTVAELTEFQAELDRQRLQHRTFPVAWRAPEQVAALIRQQPRTKRRLGLGQEEGLDVALELLRLRPERAMFAFAAVSLLGAALLSGGYTGRWGWGDALMLAAAVLRAITVCQTTRLTRHRNAPVLALTAVQSGVIGVGCLLLALALPGKLPPLPSFMQASAFWWACIYLVAGCTVFAFVAQNWALRHSSPTRVGFSAAAPAKAPPA